MKAASGREEGAVREWSMNEPLTQWAWKLLRGVQLISELCYASGKEAGIIFLIDIIPEIIVYFI